MSKRSNRRPSVPSVAVDVVTDAAIIAADPSTVPDVIPADVPTVPTVPAFDVVTVIRAAYDAMGVPMPMSPIPAAFVGMVDAIRAIMPTVPANIAERSYADIVRAFTSAFDAAEFPAHNPATPHTTRFGGLGITDAQNVVYFACAVSGVFVPADVVCCVWRAIAPSARCDYIGRGIPRGYATTTLSGYMRGDHGPNPWFPGAVDVIRPWYVAGGVTKPATR